MRISDWSSDVCSSDLGVGGDAEMAIEVGGGGRGAEAGHADDRAVGADIALPAEGRSRLDGDLERVGPQHLIAVMGWLGVEQRPAGQRDDGGGDAVLLQPFLPGGRALRSEARRAGK